MDHPALYSRPVTAIALRQRISLDRIGLIRIDHSPDDPHGGPAILYLGTLYPIFVMGSPEGPLDEFLSLTPVQARAHYILALKQAQALARAQSGDIAPLLIEEQMWLKFDDKDLGERIYQHVDKAYLPEGDHWIWGKRFDGKRPSVAFRGQDRVPVFSLLWPRFKPTVLLAGKRAQKIEGCPDADIYRHCVNPMHYDISTGATLDRAHRLRVRGIGQTTSRPTGTVRWSAAHVDQDDRVLCPYCDHRLGSIYQERYKAGILRGVGWCLFCADQERIIAENRGRYPRGVRGILPPGHFEQEMADADTNLEFARLMYADPDPTHHPDYRGQIVPPEPEQVRIVEPAGGWDDI